MGFYRQLQDELTQSQKRLIKSRGWRPTGAVTGTKPVGRNGTPVAGGSGVAAKSSGVRSMTTMTYRVPGLVAPIRQPSGMTCWATVTTMMYGWRQQQSIPIETVMGQIGQKYLDKFRADQGLASDEKGAFLATAGLQPEPPMSYSIDGWMQNLRLYGPLWVTTDEDPSANFAIHARIIVAMTTDGTPDGTSFQIVDPATATEYHEDLKTFLRKYEEEAATPGTTLRIQVVHWPATTQPLSQSRSFSASNGSRQPQRRVRSFAAAPVAWGAKVREAFRDRVREIAANLGCDPDHLMAAMAFETGETFDPTIKNGAGSGAVGLIQFMPSTAKDLGTTTADLAAMTAEQQLDYVEKYMAAQRKARGELATVEDVYMAILWPAAIGKSNSTVLFDKADTVHPKRYSQNAGLDKDKDGKITKAEAASMVVAKLAKGQKPENIK
jgi:papain like cysteine protease AvrRpt2/transglycosylase-like protein with SLT domain